MWPELVDKTLCGSTIQRCDAPCPLEPPEAPKYHAPQKQYLPNKINSVQTRCIVKGEAQKNPLFWRFSGGF